MADIFEVWGRGVDTAMDRGDELAALAHLAMIQEMSAMYAAKIIRAARRENPPTKWEDMTAAYGVPASTLYRTQDETVIRSRRAPRYPSAVYGKEEQRAQA